MKIEARPPSAISLTVPSGARTWIASFAIGALAGSAELLRWGTAQAAMSRAAAVNERTTRRMAAAYRGTGAATVALVAILNDDCSRGHGRTGRKCVNHF